MANVKVRLGAQAFECLQQTSPLLEYPLRSSELTDQCYSSIEIGI